MPILFKYLFIKSFSALTAMTSVPLSCRTFPIHPFPLVHQFLHLSTLYVLVISFQWIVVIWQAPSPDSSLPKNTCGTLWILSHLCSAEWISILNPKSLLCGSWIYEPYSFLPALTLYTRKGAVVQQLTWLSTPLERASLRATDALPTSILFVQHCPLKFYSAWSPRDPGVGDPCQRFEPNDNLVQ